MTLFLKKQRSILKTIYAQLTSLMQAIAVSCTIYNHKAFIRLATDQLQERRRKILKRDDDDYFIDRNFKTLYDGNL